jgi:hypothetical protein
MMSDEKETKTKFKGPGEWRSQAARLEKEDQSDAEEDETLVE